MKIKFHTSVAGLSFTYDANLVYDLPLEEAANCIRLGWASAEEALVPPVSETRQIKAEKATSKKQKEKR
jgi:hypothetical protein